MQCYKFFLLLIAGLLFLSGCCDRLESSCGEMRPGPCLSPCQKFAMTQPSPCCPIECENRCPYYANCGGRGKKGVINALADQGVEIIDRGQKVTILLFTDDCFDIGSANINSCCCAKLNNIVKLFRCSYSNRCSPVRITGFTDNVGDRFDRKQELTNQLAFSVASYLWAHGMPVCSMTMRGCSCNNHIASAHTPRGNAYNRRVEISFFYKN